MPKGIFRGILLNVRSSSMSAAFEGPKAESTRPSAQAAAGALRPAAETLLALLHPQSIEAQALARIHSSEIPLRDGGPDWNSYKLQHAFHAVFEKQLNAARELYLKVPSAQRADVLGDLLLNFLTDSTPVSDARLGVVKFFIGFESCGLPDRVRDRVRPSAVRALNEILCDGRLGTELNFLFRPADFGEFSAAAAQQLKEIGEQWAGGLSGGIPLPSQLLTNPNIAPIRERLINDPEIKTLGCRMLEKWVQTLGSRKDIEFEARALGLSEHLTSREFAAAVAQEIQKALGLVILNFDSPSIAIHNLNRATDLACLLGVSEAAEDPGQSAFGFPERITKLAEHAIVACFDELQDGSCAGCESLATVRRAVELFASEAFKGSAEFAQRLNVAARCLDKFDPACAESWEELLYLGQWSARTELTAILRSQIRTQIEEGISTWDETCVPPHLSHLDMESYSDLVLDERRTVAILVAGLGQESPGLEQLIRDMNLGPQELLAFERSVWPAVVERAAQKCSLEVNIAEARLLLTSEGPLSPKLIQLFRSIATNEIADGPTHSTDAVKELANAIAAVHGAAKQSRDQQGSSCRERFERVADFYVRSGTANLLRGIPVGELVLAAKRVREQAGFSSAEEPKNVGADESDPHSGEKFKELCARYNLNRIWHDMAGARRVLAELEQADIDLWHGSHRQEIINLKLNHAAASRDREAMLEAQAELVEVVDYDNLWCLSHAELERIQRSLVAVGEANLGWDRHDAELSEPDLGAARSCFERALLVEYAIEKAKLALTAADEPAPPSNQMRTMPLIINLKLALVDFKAGEHIEAEGRWDETLKLVREAVDRIIARAGTDEEAVKRKFDETGLLCRILLYHAEMYCDLEVYGPAHDMAQHAREISKTVLASREASADKNDKKLSYQVLSADYIVGHSYAAQGRVTLLRGENHSSLVSFIAAAKILRELPLNPDSDGARLLRNVEYLKEVVNARYALLPPGKYFAMRGL